MVVLRPKAVGKLENNMFKVRSPYGYSRVEASRASATVFVGPSRTRQSDRDAADINNIVRRFGVTGQLPIRSVMPQYQHFEGVFDYRSALEQVIGAEKAFMQVPAEIRARFHNDPGAFMEFCSKEQNRDELKKLGLLRLVEEPKVPEPTLVRIVSEDKPTNGS